MRLAVESGLAAYSNTTGALGECSSGRCNISTWGEYGIIRRYTTIHCGAGAATAACEIDRPPMFPELVSVEDLHAGISPSSAAGDYSDVMINSPYGAIPWTEVSRFNDGLISL
jgi:hypothetical protein